MLALLIAWLAYLLLRAARDRDDRPEQAASPKEVFEKPATEFVARFLGGHNVIATPAGAIAVRADRVALKTNGAGDNATRMNATIRGIEYQGTHYSVALENPANTDLTATVSDAEKESVMALGGLMDGDALRGQRWGDS